MAAKDRQFTVQLLATGKSASVCEQMITKYRQYIVQWLATGRSASGCKQMTANDL